MAVATQTIEGVDVSDEEEERLLRMMEDFENAEPGDKVIWDDKANPLTVRDPEDIDREPKEDTIYVQGQRKGIYELEMRTQNGIPYIHGDHGRAVENFRLLDDDGDEDGGSGGATPGGNGSKTAAQNGPVGDEYGPLSNLTVSRPPVPGQDRLLVKGTHNQAGRFELVFARDGSSAPYQLDERASAVEDGDIETVAEPVEEFLLETRNSEILPVYAEDPEPEAGSRLRGDIGWTAMADPDTEQDADDWIFEKTQDIFAEYQDLAPYEESGPLTKLRNSLPFGGAGKFTKGHTFVDELISILEVPVPRSYNEWQLFDYGIVDGPEMRSLGWVNIDTHEFILLKGERTDEDEPPNYAVYYIDEDEEPGTIDPMETATGGTHRERVQSMLMVVQDLMGAPEQLDVEVVEYAEDSPGQRFIRDTVDWEGVGRDVMDAAQSLAEEIYSGAISRGRAAVEWVQNNYKRIGYTVAVSVVNIVSHAIAAVTSVYARPKLDRGTTNLVEEVGLDIGYTYSPNRSRRSFSDATIAEVGPTGNKQDVTLQFTRNIDEDDLKERQRQRRQAITTISDALQDSGIEKPTDIEGVGDQEAAALAEEGYSTIESLIEADESELAAVEGISESLAADIKSQVSGGIDVRERLDKLARGEGINPTVKTRSILGLGAGYLGADEVGESGNIVDFLANSRTLIFSVLVVGSLDILERAGISEYEVRMPGSGQAVRAWTAQKMFDILPEKYNDLLEDFGDEARQGSGRPESDKAFTDDSEPIFLDDDSSRPKWKTPKPESNLPRGSPPTEGDKKAANFAGRKQQVASQLFSAESNAEAADRLRDIIVGEIEQQLTKAKARDVNAEYDISAPFNISDIERIVKGVAEDDIIPVVEEYWPDLLTHLNDKMEQDVQPIEHFIGFQREPEGNNDNLRPNIGSSEWFYDRVAGDLVDKDDRFTGDDFGARSTNPEKVGERVSEDDVLTNEDPREKAKADIDGYYAGFQERAQQDIPLREQLEQEDDIDLDWSDTKNRGDAESTFEDSPP